MGDEKPAIDEATPLDAYPPMEEGARKAEFLAGIDEALRQVERGETYSIEEMEKFMEEWLPE